MQGELLQRGAAVETDIGNRVGANCFGRELQWNNYLAAINAALRHASRQMGLPVIDYEPVALQLPEAHLHMADGLHPQVTGKAANG